MAHRASDSPDPFPMGSCLSLSPASCLVLSWSESTGAGAPMLPQGPADFSPTRPRSVGVGMGCCLAHGFLALDALRAARAREPQRKRPVSFPEHFCPACGASSGAHAGWLPLDLRPKHHPRLEPPKCPGSLERPWGSPGRLASAALSSSLLASLNLTCSEPLSPAPGSASRLQEPHSAAHCP